MSIRRRAARRITRALFEFGYGAPESSIRYALACGLESTWTVDGWRHERDTRADRYLGLSLARVAMLEAARSMVTVTSRHTEMLQRQSDEPD